MGTGFSRFPFPSRGRVSCREAEQGSCSVGWVCPRELSAIGHPRARTAGGGSRYFLYSQERNSQSLQDSSTVLYSLSSPWSCILLPVLCARASPGLNPQQLLETHQEPCWARSREGSPGETTRIALGPAAQSGLLEKDTAPNPPSNTCK